MHTRLHLTRVTRGGMLLGVKTDSVKWVETVLVNGLGEVNHVVWCGLGHKITSGLDWIDGSGGHRIASGNVTVVSNNMHYVT